MEGAAMKVSFLISAAAFLRLGPAASERGWRSDEDYALRVVRRLQGTANRDELARLAAMSAEFEATTLESVVAAIARFFGERPPRVEIGGVEYAVGATLAEMRPLAA
jgi:hypothetical protein